MARLIDADALIEHIKDLPTWGTGVGRGLYATKYPKGMFDCEDVISSIENASTIEPKQEWISVKDDMPRERESIFARFYGTDKWRTGMFRTASDDVIACVEYEDGSRLVKVLHTISGEWHMSCIPSGGIVTHWMPLPQPPERDDE